MERFRQAIQDKIENQPNEDAIEILLEQFPPELREKLEVQIEDLDGHDAEDLLMNRLIERNKALVKWGVDALPKEVSVSPEVPQAFLNSIKESQERGEDSYLGAGHNGVVLQSVRRPEYCYKILNQERIKQMHASVVREATMQFECYKILEGRNNVAKIPSILRYIKNPEMQAFMMDRIKGESLGELMKRGGEFPENFNAETFFEKISNAIEVLNEHGYHHRDLTNNLGNVIIDSDGEPWIIDFGSAVKGFASPENSNHYQVSPGASYIVGHDQSGVRQLKSVVENYMSKQGGRHG